uniref:hypothetical protein n=1 Tax=Paraburkholderia terrae TaxID=311230 RepID=UPI00296B0BA7
RCRAKPSRCSTSTPPVPSSQPIRFENILVLQQVSPGAESNFGLAMIRGILAKAGSREAMSGRVV